MADPTSGTEYGAPEVDFALAAEIVPHVHLANTRLLELQCQFVPFVAIPEPPYTFGIETGVAWARRPDGFSYAIRVNVSVGPDSRPEDPFWTCSAAHDVSYMAEDADRFSDESALAFGMTSAVMTAWPYLRETVQAMSARSGIAPVVLDVIRFVPGGAPQAQDGPSGAKNP